MSKQNKSEISYLNTQGVTKIIPRNGNNDYTIIPIDSYEQAHKYSEYTSWCVTRDQYEFDCYTQGGNRFYFCLKNGFENMPKNDNFAPLNDYDLSMLSVEIDMNGDLLRITTRYNYFYFKGENSKGLYSVEQLEDILDVNFYKVFLPYTRDELHSRGIILFDEVQGLLDNGKKPEDIFDYVYEFINGYAVVLLNNKYNLIDTNGKILSEQWFDVCNSFSNGYARVELNNKCNFIDTDCNYLSEQWFDDVDDFVNGYAIVKLNDKWNWIDTDCNYLSEQWFDACWIFEEGYAMVELNGKWNWIDTKCNYLTDQWFDNNTEFTNGYARVKLNGKYNFIDTNGKYITDQWFDVCYSFSNGYASVNLNNKCNFIDTNGNYLSEQWFDKAYNFSNGYASVKLNKKWNLIDTNGNIVSPNKWYNTVEDLNIMIRQAYK